MSGYFIAAGLTTVAILFALAGRLFASRTPNPRKFLIGSRVAGLGFVLLWLLPVGTMALKAAEWSMPLMVAALFIAGSFVAGGLRAMERAATGERESPLDQALNDIIIQNDLP